MGKRTRVERRQAASRFEQAAKQKSEVTSRQQRTGKAIQNGHLDYLIAATGMTAERLHKIGVTHSQKTTGKKAERLEKALEEIESGNLNPESLERMEKNLKQPVITVVHGAPGSAPPTVAFG